MAQQERFIFQAVSFDFGQLLLSLIVLLLLMNVLTTFTYKRMVHFLVGLFCFQGWIVFQKFEAAQKEEVIILHQT